MLHLLSVDPEALGRFDHASLTQQGMMELFLNDPNNHCASEGNGGYSDITDWRGVRCNENGEVLSIVWQGGIHRGPKTPYDLQWIPPTVEQLELTRHPASNFAAAYFPKSIGNVYISKCDISGTLEANELPRKISSLFLADNLLCGSIEWSALPRALVSLDLAKNHFEGSILCVHFPPFLEWVDLSRNNFSGSVDCADLPENLGNIRLNHNELSGEIDLSMYCGDVEEDLGVMYMHHNAFAGAIRYTGKHVKKLYKFGRNGEDSVLNDAKAEDSQSVDNAETKYRDRSKGYEWNAAHTVESLDGTAYYVPEAFIYCVENRFTSIDWQSMIPVQHLDASMNALSGSLSIRDIPRFLQYLNVSDNSYSGSLDFSGFSNDRIGLSQFRASSNNFSGSLDFAHLPKNLQQIDLSNNQLSGDIKFGGFMPDCVIAENNALTGIGAKVELSDNLCILKLSNNKIASKSIRLSRLPYGLEMIDLRGNRINQCFDYKGGRNRDHRLKFDRGTREQRQSGAAGVVHWKEIP